MHIQPVNERTTEFEEKVPQADFVNLEFWVRWISAMKNKRDANASFLWNSIILLFNRRLDIVDILVYRTLSAKQVLGDARRFTNEWRDRNDANVN